MVKSIHQEAATRTIAELSDAIRDALLRFTPDECANYFSGRRP
jgi:hypothetical protein